MTFSPETPQNTPLALVVDDDAWVRTYTSTVLRSTGIRVVEAIDGIHALTLFRGCDVPFDLVITDIRMPRMTGIELAASLRSICPSIPLIFVSGEPAPRIQWGVSNRLIFIEKPFGPAALLKAAHQCLQWNQTGDCAPWPAEGWLTQSRPKTYHRPPTDRG